MRLCPLYQAFCNFHGGVGIDKCDHNPECAHKSVDDTPPTCLTCLESICCVCHVSLKEPCGLCVSCKEVIDRGNLPRG